MDYRKKHGLAMLGIASSNVRRQLKRLKDLYLIETNSNLYRVTEFGHLSEVFEEKIENFVLGTAMHTENKEMMVVYRDLSSNELYVRPKEMFLENVMKEGKEVPRFKYIKD